jgi:hypothetical protein
MLYERQGKVRTARDTFEIAFAAHQVIVPAAHGKPLAKN